VRASRARFVPLLLALSVVPGEAVGEKAVSDKANFVQGERLLKQGDIDGALRAFTAAIRSAPRDPRGYYQRGVCHGRKDDAASAMADYRRALKLKGDFAEANNNLGALLHEQGKTKEAQGYLRRAVRAKADYGEAWFNLGLVLYDMGRVGDAAKAYERAARLRPRDVDVRINLGAALRRAGDLDSAVRQLKMAVGLAPRDPMTRFNYGSLLMEKKRDREASSQLAEAVKLDHKHLRAWHRLALVQARLGSFEEAARSMQRARRLAPTSAAVRCDLGKIYRKWGKVAKAMAEYRAALKLDPKYAKAHLLIGLAHAGEGRCRAARRAFAAFVRARRDLPPKTLEKLTGQCKRK